MQKHSVPSTHSSSSTICCIILLFRKSSQIGEWNSEVGLKLEKTHNLNIVHGGVPNLMVVTIEEPPYVMLKCRNCTGNKRYEGFAIDLLNSISKVSFL